MRELVHRIFLKHGFEAQKIVENNFYQKNFDNGVAYYWLVVEVESLSIVLDNQDKWFEECKRVMGFSDFDKNTSLLIIAPRQNNQNWRKELVTIEDDPFQFKKYILGYTQEAFEGLIRNSENGDPNVILKLIANESTFSQFKDSYSEFSWLSLLYSLSQKLPFLELDIKLEKGLDNLFLESKKRIEDLKLYPQFERIEQLISSTSIEDLKFEDLHSIILEED